MTRIKLLGISTILFWSLAYSASSSVLEYTTKPLPYRPEISELEILAGPQSVSAITRMAMLVELAHHLQDNITHPSEQKAVKIPMPILLGQLVRSLPEQISLMNYLIPSDSMLAGLFWPYISCPFSHVLAPAIKAALVNLLIKSKTTFDTLPEETKRDCYLIECNAPHCTATRAYNPLVRTMFAEKFVEGTYLRQDSYKVYASFASGLLHQDLELLRTFNQCNKNNIDPETLILIDPIYSSLFPMKENTRLDVELDASLHDSIDYISYHNKVPHHAFIKTAHIFALTRIIDQFKTEARKLYPGLKHMYLYSNAQQYVKDCSTDPSIRADLLNACDIPYESSGEWEHAKQFWQDLTCIHDQGLTPRAISCSLASFQPHNNEARMQIVYNATKGTQIWHYTRASAWRKLTSKEVRTDLTAHPSFKALCKK